MNQARVTLNDAELVCNQYQINDIFHCQKSKIALVTKGNYTLFRKEESIRLQPGDVFVSSAGDYFISSSPNFDTAHAIILDIPSTLIKQVLGKLMENDFSVYEKLKKTPVSSFELIKDPMVADRITNLWNLKMQKNNFFKLFSELYLQEIILKLIQQKTANLLANMEKDLPHQSKVSKATQFIKNNYHKNDLSIDQLAKIAGMSRASFYTQFKQIVGQTPNNFLNKIRINRAQFLLRCSDKSIKQIGYEVGFVTGHHFINRFKKMVGETPGVFRKKFELASNLR